MHGSVRSHNIPGAGYSTFRELFLPDNGDPVRLSIPEYQRYYDWRKKQRNDLFDDLECLQTLHREGRLAERGGHFCGTIICTPAGRGIGRRFDVVDGQQRLTTLVLTHALLSRSVGKTSFVLVDDNILFRPQRVDQGCFGSIIREGSGAQGHQATLAQRNYAEAAHEIEDWIGRLGTASEYDLPCMLELIEDRLQFIFFVPPDNDEVSKVFETINNRGKPLTQMDLVKNHLIYMRALYDWDGEDVNAVWQAIQRDTLDTDFRGGEDVDTVLRAVVNAMFRPGRRDAGETDFKVVKDRIASKQDGKTFRDFLSFLKIAFTTFRTLRAAHKSSKSDAVGTQLTYLNHHPNIAGVLPLILVREWRRREERTADVLEAIEKANFRLYGLMNGSKRADSHNVVLHKLAHEYLRTEPDAELVVWCGGQEIRSTSIIDMLTGIVRAQHKDGLHQIVEALTLDDDEGDDYYHWDALRYFLARWEESLRDNQSFEFGRLRHEYHCSHSNDYLAREHIVPAKSPAAILSYRDRQQLRRLGNFMLLSQGVNATLSKGPLDDKVAALDDATNRNALLVQNMQLRNYVTKAQAFRAHLESRNDPVFGADRTRFNGSTREQNGPVAEAKTLCDLREEDMIAFALRTWRMPGEPLGHHEGKAFAGVLSFRFEEETYLSNEETPATKDNQNYVLFTRDRATSDGPDVARRKRLRRRNEVLDRTTDQIRW